MKKINKKYTKIKKFGHLVLDWYLLNTKGHFEFNSTFQKQNQHYNKLFDNLL